MASQGTNPTTPMVLLSRALLAALNLLDAEFPDVDSLLIYDKVAEARVAARNQLPNVEAYRRVIEQHARVSIVAAIATPCGAVEPSAPELVSTGNRGPGRPVRRVRPAAGRARRPWRG
jgi:hypothetical protein